MAYRSYPVLGRRILALFRHRNGSKAVHGLFNGCSGGVFDASFSIAAEATNMIDVTITLKDEQGAALGAGVAVELLVLANSSGTDFTANTYTLAAGSLGKIATVVSNKIVKAITGTGGIVNLQITNAGAVTCYVGVVLPAGRQVISGAVTHA